MEQHGVLQLKDLNVQYTTDGLISKVVSDLNLTIYKGEIVGIVGETGAGKTTLALSIMRLLSPYITKIQGEIFFQGENLLEVKKNKMQKIRGNKISMIFQDPMSSLNPVFTINSQISDVIRLHNPKINNKEINDKVDEVLKLVGIPLSRKNEYPHQFSGGMKQRVMIAIAIACKPDFLLADEPTTALDVTIQAQIMEMIKALKNDLGLSVMLITHDLGIVADSCDKVVVMYCGEIVEMGTLEDVFDKSKPHHPYTRGLFEAIPDINSKERRLKSIEGSMPLPFDLPEGCKFYPRCSMCMEECKKNEIPVIKNNTHIIKCLLYKKIEDVN